MEKKGEDRKKKKDKIESEPGGERWKSIRKKGIFNWVGNLKVKSEDWINEQDGGIQKWNKLRDRFSQIKWCFGLYIPLCIFLAFAGSLIIGNIMNYLQDWVVEKYEIKSEMEYEYVMWYDDKETPHYGYVAMEKDLSKQNIIYDIVSLLQFFLIPLWILLSVYFTGKIFYNRQLKIPINLLLDASRRIADNQLDFRLEYDKPNEFGMLCRAFDEMRSALYDSNRQLWRSLEERKRLNAAFSHDLRTPLTVLRGYADFLEKYLPSGNVSEEKLLEVLGMMSGQIVRLEHYTQTMNSVQKLGDIVPNLGFATVEQIRNSFLCTGEMICAGKEFKLEWQGDGLLCFDTELVLQIYENLVSNAFRYANTRVLVQCAVENEMLVFVVMDDGKGFSQEALRHAAEPFFRDESEPDKTHFGLGLYICRILCEKCGGILKIENVLGEEEGAHGGKVIAMVACKNNKEK